MQNRQGCLAGLFELFLLGTVYDRLQRDFGFGRGCSCSGCGIGCLLFIIAIAICVSIIFSTNWLRPLFSFV